MCRFHHAFSVVTLVGGMPLPIDRQRIEGGVDILVATPGRMADHLKNTQGFADRVGKCSVFILDEADRMLDMGF